MAELTQERVILLMVQSSEAVMWSLPKEGWTHDAKYGVCYWEHIECDDGIITGIFLSDEGLEATLPSQLGHLTGLKQIDMPKNNIKGSIPSEVARLHELEVFNLDSNKLTGSIPTFKSTFLREFSVGHNELRGTLPADIGSWYGRLTEFDVNGNRFSGQIPSSFCVMSSLTSLSLSDNLFSGMIPGRLGTLSNLEYLYLDHNNLMGTIPINIARPSSSMKELWLQENMLSGTIPNTVADMEDLFNFYIDGNKFTGTVPPELCKKELNADFYKNVPDSVPRNYCDSVACSAGWKSNDGMYPCLPCDNKNFNPYLGRVGECIDIQEVDILKTIHDGSGGRLWENITGHHCSLDEITCDSHQNVLAINLSYKGLRGTIPPELGFLSYLETLDLSNNLFTGFIPVDLRFSPLQNLDLSSNELIGIVPQMLCEKAGINGNGDGGEFSCDRIVCPRGTYSPSGRNSFDEEGGQCIPCDVTDALGQKGANNFIGSKACYVPEEEPKTFISTLSEAELELISVGGGGVNILMGAVGFILVLFFVFIGLQFRKKRKKDRRGEILPQEEYELPGISMIS